MGISFDTSFSNLKKKPIAHKFLHKNQASRKLLYAIDNTYM